MISTYSKTKERGYARQQEMREMERTIKKGALVYVQWNTLLGRSREQTAERIGLSGGTLRSWERSWKQDRLPARGRGRPPCRAVHRQEEEVRETLMEMGPYIGVPLLQSLYPGIPRREIEYLLWQYREEYVTGQGVLIHMLRWAMPHAVWAIDYTKPPLPVDGIYRQILMVRDLGTGDHLEALPVPEKGSVETRDALESLFKKYGPPLSIKSDNGGEVSGKEVIDLLQRYKVIFHLTPPSCAWYNGSCEAGNGSFKVRAHHISARNGRPGEWTCDDVEAARVRANRTARPWGIKGPTPEEIWNERKPLSYDLRKAFIRSRNMHRHELAAELGYNVDEKISAKDKAWIERKSVERAYVEHGILSIRRRRINPPINSNFRRKIS